MLCPPSRPALLVVTALVATGCRAPELPLSPAFASQRLDELARRSGQALLAPPPGRGAVYRELLDELRAIQPLLEDSGRQTTARVLQARLGWELHAAAVGAASDHTLDVVGFTLRLAADGVQDATPASVQAQILSLLGAARRGGALRVVDPGVTAVDVEAVLGSQPAWQRALHPRLVLEGWALLKQLAARDHSARPTSAPAGDDVQLLACARALVDTGVHGLAIRHAQATAVLTGQAALDDAQAARELQQIHEHPGQATAAALGAHALAQTLAKLRAVDATWDASRLATATLASGPLDQLGLMVLERRLLAHTRSSRREDAGRSSDVTD